MQTITAPKAGNAPDLLQGILSVQVRNEDKITIARRSKSCFTRHSTRLTAGTPSSRKKPNNTKPNVSSITKKTARFPCVISTLTITTGKTIRTTSSGRSTLSTIWWIRTETPTQTLRTASFLISTGLTKCRFLSIK